MKAYMYDTETGLYEGETFESEDFIKLEDGLTTSAPPSYDKGQIPVFDLNEQRWSLVPLTVMRERLNTRNSPTITG